jgi:hypothetical protein
LGGTTVTITGTDFTGATAVMFGTNAATSVVVVSATSITAVAPAGMGTVDVTVTTPEGTSAIVTADEYTYAPTVTGLSPNHGPAFGGNDVTITGTGFADATGVTFNGISGTGFHVSSDTTIIVTAPASAVGGPVDVIVNTAADPSAAVDYTYAPVVDTVAPTGGAAAGGTDVTITGTDFTGATAVNFGSHVGTIVSWTATVIHATAPAGTGLVDLTVTTGAGTSVPVGYTYAP